MARRPLPAILALALVCAGCGGTPEKKVDPVEDAPAIARGVLGKLHQNQKRLCVANQKMISGAFTMLQLDDPGGFTHEDVGTLKLFQVLRAKGYAQTVPLDPGQGEGSFVNYSMSADGKVTCRVHGSED